jgi:hypothetical protein
MVTIVHEWHGGNYALYRSSAHVHHGVYELAGCCPSQQLVGGGVLLLDLVVPTVASCGLVRCCVSSR